MIMVLNFLYLFLLHYGQSSFVVNIDVDKFQSAYMTSTKINKDWKRRYIESGFINIDILLRDNWELKLRLKIKTLNIFYKNTALYEETIQNYLDFVEGFILTKEDSSYVRGYIDNAHFYGSIHIPGSIIYIDELESSEDMPVYNAIVYEHKNKVFPEENYLAAPFNHSNIQNYIKTSYDEASIFKSIINNGKVCSLFVLLDNSFLRIIHHNNEQSAIAHTILAIEEANSLFRSTDFDDDGFPDNVGFIIKYFVIIREEYSPINVVPDYTERPIEGNFYLDMFSRYDLLNDVCLGVAFTGQSFTGGTVGLSYTALPRDKNVFRFQLGGICDRPFKSIAGRNLNTLVISAMLQNGARVESPIFELSLAHELGHSFGSDHDQQEDCQGYLMTAHTPENDDRNHFVFSKCSKRMIMNGIINQGHCLEDDNSEYCGNGRIEANETCDCGTVRDCLDFDACCIPRGRSNACQINRNKGFQCHPSQGICCSTKCMYNDFSRFDLDCQDFEKFCPCPENKQTCSCGIKGKCMGNVCSSEECTRLNLQECECPENSGKSCHTCCLFNDLCISSSILTRKLIKTESFKNITINIKKYSKLAHPFGFYDNLCDSNNTNCLKFYFRDVEEGYCLLFGKIGICSEEYKCVVPEMTRVYPEIKMRNKPDKSCKLNMSHILLVALICIPFSINTMYKVF